MKTIFGKHEANTLKQLDDVAKNAVDVALMADGHLGYVMPVGGVAAYDNKVSVVGVGYDIACGNAAIRTNIKAVDLDEQDWHALADRIQKEISFGVGRTNASDDAPVDHELFASPAWHELPDTHTRDKLRAKARQQLGTVGSGNHYVDVLVDENGDVWVGVHFGSRGLGHTIASGFMALAQNKEWGDKVPEQETLLDIHDLLGAAYWELMELAGEYAYVGREWVTRKVVSFLGGEELELVHNHHNFAWREIHRGTELIVVRKGATPAFPGQRGFVGGSMGDDAVIVEGADGEYEGDGDITKTQESALFSTVHGAGRVLGRAEAIRGKVIKDARGIPTGKRDESTKILPEKMQEWIGRFGTVLRGGGVDEAPQAYRRLSEVLNAQGPTIKILHTLTPRVVVMAGNEVRDPYKD